MTDKKRCDWIKDRGYWKGYQCSNDGRYSHEGKIYCHAHLALAMNPERVKKQPKG